MRARRLILVAVGFLAVSGAVVANYTIADQERTVTVTGCVERDAASTTPVYKIIVPQTGGKTEIYQLTSENAAEVSASVGKTARVTGTVVVEKRAGREIKVLQVKELAVMADKCDSPSPTSPQ